MWIFKVKVNLTSGERSPPCGGMKGLGDERRVIASTVANPLETSDLAAMPLFASSPVVAVLGPTNTGKSHLAVERMCGHASGMIGFPLRLLAREVYDRVVAIKGADKVVVNDTTVNALAVEDVTGDGTPDLVIGGYVEPGLLLLQGRGDESFNQAHGSLRRGRRCQG